MNISLATKANQSKSPDELQKLTKATELIKYGISEDHPLRSAMQTCLVLDRDEFAQYLLAAREVVKFAERILQENQKPESDLQTLFRENLNAYGDNAQICWVRLNRFTDATKEHAPDLFQHFSQQDAVFKQLDQVIQALKERVTK